MRLMLGQSHAKLGEDADARSIFMEMINENPNGSYASQAVHQLTYLLVNDTNITKHSFNANKF